jgi:Recombinase
VTVGGELPARPESRSDRCGSGDVLAAWALSLTSQAAGRSRGRLRFAFYGRVPTEDWQDPVTSRARQLQQAVMLVAGHGVIVAEFFDIGESRTLPWARRPQAAALVAQLADPDRGWDAIVIGDYERAFYASQYASMAPLFEHYGIGLWMPEVGGRVDWHAEDPANPRYTGRQVWNRQRTDFDLVDPANTGLGHRQVQRWNLPEGWVISKQPAHPALVSEAGFIAAQDTAAPRGPAGPAARRYLLAGLLACGRCGRKLESAWSNGKPRSGWDHEVSSLSPRCGVLPHGAGGDTGPGSPARRSRLSR